MVVHWETSLKPLYVRTVWIDGRRHAILSKDDPVAKALSPIVSSTRGTNSRNTSPLYSPTSTLIQSPTFVLNANPLNLTNIQRRTTSNSDCCPDSYRVERHCFTAGKTEEVKVERNPLSERVLQWLDLAGRENIKLGIDEVRLFASRHSMPEVETTNNKYLTQYSTNADRRVHHHSSRKQTKNQRCYKTDNEDNEKYSDCQSHVYPMTFVSDNIQNYAKKSYNNIDNNGDSYFPTRMSLSANVISFHDDSANNSAEAYENRSSKNKKQIKRLSSMSTLDIALRPKSNDDEQIDNYTRPEKQSTMKGSFESQYIEMIRKKMNEVNFKAARRQLHIFIPSLPKTLCESKTSSVLTVDDS